MSNEMKRFWLVILFLIMLCLTILYPVIGIFAMVLSYSIGWNVRDLK